MNVADNGSQEVQYALERKQSNTNSANGVNKKYVLNSQPSFQQLNPSEKEELEAKLYTDVRKMKYRFGCLVTRTRDSVEERIPTGKFAGSILALGAYEPAPEEEDQSLLNEHKEEIKMAKSISDIFLILSAYWNYLSYEILEFTIELYGTDDDKKRLKSYNEELHNFCKRRLFELSLPENGSSTGNASNPKLKRFKVKLNVRECITCQDLLRIKERIAEILHVNLATLIIDRVDPGCVQLTFLIPNFVAQKIFPLSNKQIAVLSKDTSMIRLECGIYVFEVYMFIYGLARVTTFIASVFLFSYPDPPLCIYCKYVFILSLSLRLVCFMLSSK